MSSCYGYKSASQCDEDDCPHHPKEPCDSPELAAIRARASYMRSCDLPLFKHGIEAIADRYALLRMVDELQSRPLFWSFKEACRERDAEARAHGETQAKVRDLEKLLKNENELYRQATKRAEAAEARVRELEQECVAYRAQLEGRLR